MGVVSGGGDREGGDRVSGGGDRVSGGGDRVSGGVDRVRGVERVVSGGG